MKKIKLESQSLLQVGNKFSLFNEDRPEFEIIEETAPRVFKVKRLPTAIIDEEQQIPHPTGDYPCWKFEEEE